MRISALSDQVQHSTILCFASPSLSLKLIRCNSLSETKSKGKAHDDELHNQNLSNLAIAIQNTLSIGQAQPVQDGMRNDVGTINSGKNHEGVFNLQSGLGSGISRPSVLLPLLFN